MNGLIIPNTPIAVDFWKPRQCPHVKLYFLTHMHADHTAGLSSSWNYHKIYCSEVTKKLAQFKFGIKEEFLVSLPMDQPVTIPVEECGTEFITVTAIDARHCPGAVMFIFEGYFGRILYTGDFRYTQTMSCDPTLGLNNEKKAVDILYLDNTYCDPKCVFPTRAKATAMAINRIQQYPEHDVVIGLRTLGKEELLLKIALTFNSWIAVDPKRFNFLRICEQADVFSTDTDSTRFHVVNAAEITKLNFEKWNKERPTIVILPTSLYVGSRNPFRNVEGIFIIPYSDHSSYTELQEFVGLVRPKKVIPIVSKHLGTEKGFLNPRTHMNIFDDKLDPEPQKEFFVPAAVQKFMTMKPASPNSNSLSLKRQGSSLSCRPRKLVKPCGVVFSSAMSDSANSAPHKPENKTEHHDEKKKTEICSSEQVKENSSSTLHSANKSYLRENSIQTMNIVNEEKAVTNGGKSLTSKGATSNKIQYKERNIDVIVISDDDGCGNNGVGEVSICPSKGTLSNIRQLTPKKQNYCEHMRRRYSHHTIVNHHSGVDANIPTCSRITSQQKKTVFCCHNCATCPTHGIKGSQSRIGLCSTVGQTLLHKNSISSSRIKSCQNVLKQHSAADILDSIGGTIDLTCDHHELHESKALLNPNGHKQKTCNCRISNGNGNVQSHETGKASCTLDSVVPGTFKEATYSYAESSYNENFLQLDSEIVKAISSFSDETLIDRQAVTSNNSGCISDIGFSYAVSGNINASVDVNTDDADSDEHDGDSDGIDEDGVSGNDEDGVNGDNDVGVDDGNVGGDDDGYSFNDGIDDVGDGNVGGNNNYDGSNDDGDVDDIDGGIVDGNVLGIESSDDECNDGTVDDGETNYDLDSCCVTSSCDSRTLLTHGKAHISRRDKTSMNVSDISSSSDIIQSNYLPSSQLVQNQTEVVSFHAVKSVEKANFNEIYLNNTQTNLSTSMNTEKPQRISKVQISKMSLESRDSSKDGKCVQEGEKSKNVKEICTVNKHHRKLPDSILSLVRQYKKSQSCSNLHSDSLQKKNSYFYTTKTKTTFDQQLFKKEESNQLPLMVLQVPETTFAETSSQVFGEQNTKLRNCEEIQKTVTHTSTMLITKNATIMNASKTTVETTNSTAFSPVLLNQHSNQTELEESSYLDETNKDTITSEEQMKNQEPEITLTEAMSSNIPSILQKFDVSDEVVYSHDDTQMLSTVTTSNCSSLGCKYSNVSFFSPKPIKCRPLSVVLNKIDLTKMAFKNKSFVGDTQREKELSMQHFKSDRESVALSNLVLLPGEELMCSPMLKSLKADCCEEPMKCLTPSSELQTVDPTALPTIPCLGQTSGTAIHDSQEHLKHSPVKVIYGETNNFSVTKSETKTTTDGNVQEIKSYVPQCNINGKGDKTKDVKIRNINPVRKTKPRTSVYGARLHSAWKIVQDALNKSS